MDRRTRSSVLLVREWEHQVTGSGCCGRLEGEFLGSGDDAVFAERRAVMERMGPVYRAIKDRFRDEVDVEVVDPRNVSLLFLLLRDFWTYRVGVRAALTTLAKLPKQGVILNGRLLDRSDHPDAARIVASVEEASYSLLSAVSGSAAEARRAGT